MKSRRVMNNMVRRIKGAHDALIKHGNAKNANDQAHFPFQRQPGQPLQLGLAKDFSIPYYKRHPNNNSVGFPSLWLGQFVVPCLWKEWQCRILCTKSKNNLPVWG